MGLIVPQTVKVRPSGKAYRHYKEKGYEFEKRGDLIEVDAMDLYPGSHEKVKIICDICGNESEIEYRHFVENRKKGVLVSCASNSCRNKKYEDTCMEKYGVKHAFQAEEVKEKTKQTNLKNWGVEYATQAEEIKNKIKDTNLERHGCMYVLQSEEIRNKGIQTLKEKYGEDITNAFQAEEVKEKIKQTNLKNWGVEYATQSEEIKEKTRNTNNEKYGADYYTQTDEYKDRAKKTCQLHHGVDNPSQSQEIKNKKIETCRKHWGVDYPFQSDEVRSKTAETLKEKYGESIINISQVEEIKNKALDSFQFNGTGPSSRAQRYINHILNGTLNKHICGSLVDIYIEKENIIIEHDGSGHFLGDIMNGNKTPTKESLLYEKEREYKIINNGYRMIRFIANKDRIPSDEVILNLIEELKNSDFKVIRINFEEGTIEKDYNEKSCYVFGELRKITQKDLEQFEK